MESFREGIIVRLENEAAEVAYSEIAPLESFGSESLRKSLKCLKSFCGVIREDDIVGFDGKAFPCTAYALQTACQSMHSKQTVADGRFPLGLRIPSAGLIHLDRLNVDAPILQSSEISVFKAKICGDEAQFESQLRSIERLFSALPSSVKLRFDANESLSLDQAKKLLALLERFSTSVEFLEQPLDRLMLEEMHELRNRFDVKIALDESLSIAEGIVSHQGAFDDSWIWVAKPSLGDMGVLNRLSVPENRIVISSVFETRIGFSQLLNHRFDGYVPGLGTQQYFNQTDPLAYPVEGDTIIRVNPEHEVLWNLLA